MSTQSDSAYFASLAQQVTSTNVFPTKPNIPMSSRGEPAWDEVGQSVEDEIKRLLPNGSKAIIGLIFTELNREIVSLVDAVRFISVLCNTCAFLGTQKLAALIAFFEKLEALERLQTPIKRALAIQGWQMPPAERLPEDLASCVEVLEIPGIQNSWKVLWSLTSSLQILGHPCPQWLKQSEDTDPYRIPESAPPDDRSWWPPIGPETKPPAATSEDTVSNSLLGNIKANPANPESYVNAALYLVDKQQYCAAKEHVVSALRLVPGHPNLLRLQEELEIIISKVRADS